MSSLTCIECKSEIPRELDLCPECGFNFADAQPIECPECLKMVVFTGGICPECGFPYDALDELLLEEEVGSEEGGGLASQAEQLPAVAKAAAASAALSAPSAAGSLAPEQVSTLDQLISDLGSYLQEVKSTNSSTFADLSAGVEKFLENVEKLRVDNENTLQGMQEIAANFGNEIKTLMEGINSAKATAITELTTAAQQGKSQIMQTSSEIQQKVGGTVDYIFYICLAMVFFTALNMVVTMYVVKLIK